MSEITRMLSGPRAKIMVAAFALAALVISASCIVGITSEPYKSRLSKCCSIVVINATLYSLSVQML